MTELFALLIKLKQSDDGVQSTDDGVQSTDDGVQMTGER